MIITVSDESNSDSTNFTLEVRKSNITESPQITTQNVLIAYVGTQYFVNYTASDLDTPINNLIWTMKTNTSWLSFSTNQVLSGTPSSADIGLYWVNITVSDGSNNDSTNFTLEVRKSNITESPQITTQNVLSVYVGILYSVNYSATDLDTPKNKLSWTMKTNGSWLTFSMTQTLFGTPTSSDIGTYWVYIAVSDGNNSDSTNFTLTVMLKKEAPNVTLPKVISIHPENNTYNLSINTSEIIITFSKPMNRSSVESAFSISPYVNYTLVWENNNTVLRIILKENLNGE